MDSEQERPNIRPKKKKKKKGKAAKRSLPQSVRLEQAKKWLETYSGENVLKDYRKKFATDRMQTLQELQLLGLTFTEEQIAKEKRAVEARRQQELAKKRKRKSAGKETGRPPPGADRAGRPVFLYRRLHLRWRTLRRDLGRNGAEALGTPGGRLNQSRKARNGTVLGLSCSGPFFYAEIVKEAVNGSKTTICFRAGRADRPRGDKKCGQLEAVFNHRFPAL